MDVEGTPMGMITKARAHRATTLVPYESGVMERT
jgi:hypothetical protein